MSLSFFLLVFGLIFIAELGDKTLLTGMLLARRFGPWRAFVGIALAFLLLDALAVLVGRLFAQFVAPGWLRLVGGVFFAVLGALSIASRNHSENTAGAFRKDRGAVPTSFFMTLSAEMGDKTQIMAILLAAQLVEFWPVFLGTTLALWCVSLLGIFVGVVLARRMPIPQIRLGSGVAFIAFGGFLAWQGLILNHWIARPEDLQALLF